MSADEQPEGMEKVISAGFEGRMEVDCTLAGIGCRSS